MIWAYFLFISTPGKPGQICRFFWIKLNNCEVIRGQNWGVILGGYIVHLTGDWCSLSICVDIFSAILRCLIWLLGTFTTYFDAFDLNRVIYRVMARGVRDVRREFCFRYLPSGLDGNGGQGHFAYEMVSNPVCKVRSDKDGIPLWIR